MDDLRKDIFRYGGYRSYERYQEYLKEKEKERRRAESLAIKIVEVGIMLFSVISGLVVGWILKFFGFYTGVFVGFLTPLVSFEVTVPFYYGVCVVISLICYIISVLTVRRNSK